MPTESPSEEPTEIPTEPPTEEPTESPIDEPTESPTEEPTETPIEEPTETAETTTLGDDQDEPDETTIDDENVDTILTTLEQTTPNTQQPEAQPLFFLDESLSVNQTTQSPSDETEDLTSDPPTSTTVTDTDTSVDTSPMEPTTDDSEDETTTEEDEIARRRRITKGQETTVELESTTPLPSTPSDFNLRSTNLDFEFPNDNLESFSFVKSEFDDTTTTQVPSTVSSCSSHNNNNSSMLSTVATTHCHFPSLNNENQVTYSCYTDNCTEVVKVTVLNCTNCVPSGRFVTVTVPLIVGSTYELLVESFSNEKNQS
uniref:CSON014210 protein n=1 Tax=Culicoides sonorensis TaxID=179676 RepID=A0A336KRT1_CULSO